MPNAKDTHDIPPKGLGLGPNSPLALKKVSGCCRMLASRLRRDSGRQKEGIKWKGNSEGWSKSRSRIREPICNVHRFPFLENSFRIRKQRLPNGVIHLERDAWYGRLPPISTK